MGTFVIKMPDVGEGVAGAELVEWSVKPGDLIREDDIVAAVMTDKATVEIPAPVSGTVIWLAGEIGDQIAVGAELMHMDVEGEGNRPGAAAVRLREAAGVAEEPQPASGPASPQTPAAPQKDPEVRPDPS